MVKRDFVAQVAVRSKDTKYTGAGSGIFDPGELAHHLIPGVKGGQLFAYLFRRFGYPSFGWDDYKQLVMYMITTPIQDVFVSITPYLGGDYSQGYDCTDHMFGYCVAQVISEEYRKCDEWEAHPRYKEYVKAFEVAIRDLLRPVYVRDVPINCYGRVLDEECEKLPESVEPYHAAGYPIPTAFFKSTERYEAFTGALITLGGGSMDKGIDNVIKTAATVRLYESEEQDHE